MDAQLRALSDSTRRRILTMVWREERTAGEIASGFAMTRPSVSQHLAVLLESDLVIVRRADTRRFYRANREAVQRLRSELEALWDDGLDELKRQAEASYRRKKGP